MREADRKYYEANKAAIAERRKARYWSDPEAAREKCRKQRESRGPARLEVERKYRERNRERLREMSRDRERGLEPGQYERMLQEQGGVCAICGGGPESSAWGKLAVDHCHKTGVIRALLCQPCNTTLGRLEKDVDRAEAIIRFWMKHDPDAPSLIGRDADDQLRACQAVVQADREAINGGAQ